MAHAKDVEGTDEWDAVYDYGDLAEDGKAFGFFVGWFGQQLLYDTHFARSQENFYSSVPQNDLLDSWELCRREARRLLLMIEDYCDRTHISNEDSRIISVSASLHYLIDEYGPEGYRTSLQAQRERALLDQTFFDCYDENRCDQDESIRYFPDLFASDSRVAPGEFFDICTRIYKTVFALGNLIENPRAIELGASLAGVIFSFYQRNRVATAKIIMRDLVDYGLLREECVPEVLRGRIALPVRSLEVTEDNMEMINRQMEAVQGIPDEICARRGVTCPPMGAGFARFLLDDEEKASGSQSSSPGSDLGLGLPQDCLNCWQKPWQGEHEDYMLLSYAMAKFVKNRKTALNTWSGRIREPEARIRFMTHGKRVQVHIGDFVAYLCRLNDLDPECMSGVQLQYDKEHKKKTKGL